MIPASRKLFYSGFFKIVVWLCISLGIQIQVPYKVFAAANPSEKDVTDYIQKTFITKDTAMLKNDIEEVKALYDMKNRHGVWSFEYEAKKMKYLQNWQEKQGIKFTDIKSKVIINNIKKGFRSFSTVLLCSTEYKYAYENQKKLVSSFRIGGYHYMELQFRGDKFIVLKEWYGDPFADSLHLDTIKSEEIKQFISEHKPREFKELSERRKKAVEYANKYCGTAGEEKYGYKYNKKYRNYNDQGGDCTNFASQILYEGAQFKKNYLWNYDGSGATRAWLNADGFKEYMIFSGRASVIAYGSYEKVYKSSFELLPGDFIAYENNGDITHISMVTAADSKGYLLVTSHNTDRNNVPWDLGWSDKNIKFYLIKVNY